LKKKFDINKTILGHHRLCKEFEVRPHLEYMYREIGEKLDKVYIYKSYKEYTDKAPEYKEHRGLKHQIEYINYCMNNKNKCPSDALKFCRFLIRHKIFSIVFDSNHVHICPLPRHNKTDRLNEFHCLNDMAIKWFDNTGEYYIHGIKFPKRMFYKVSKRKMSTNDVVSIGNIERRFIALQHYGIDKIMKDLDCSLIDKSDRKNELYKVDLNGLEARMLKYTCPSTNRVYTCFVPQKYASADASMAWKFKLTMKDYEGLKIEA